MIATVLSVLGVVLAVSVFVALYVWTRRTERDVELPTKSQLSDQEGNTLRLGIALSANQPGPGF